MAGFFSLGGGGGGASSRGTSSNNNNASNNPQDPNHPNEISPETLFFYTRNQESSLPYNKGTFELWQYPQEPPPPPPPPSQQHHHQQQHLHPHHPHHHRQNPLMLQDLYSLAIGSTSRGGGGGAAGINVYEDQSSSRSDQAFVVMGSTATSSGAAGNTGNICCQDCGNQAKKDCAHMRCRSCCKSRGFECTTHVKSTWVPAAKRRVRHQHIASMLEQQQQQLHEEQKLQMNNVAGITSGRDQQHPKRVKESNTSSRLPTTSNRPSGLELANLPAEVNTSAVFRCVRVSSIDNSEDQYAYQTALSIGGHTFKGILYDQGPEAQYFARDTSSGGSGSGNIPQLNLTTATSTTSPATTTASAFLDNSLYPNSYMAGTHFFQQPPRS